MKNKNPQTQIADEILQEGSKEFLVFFTETLVLHLALLNTSDKFVKNLLNCMLNDFRKLKENQNGYRGRRVLH